MTLNEIATDISSRGEHLLHIDPETGVICTKRGKYRYNYYIDCSDHLKCIDTRSIQVELYTTK